MRSCNHYYYCKCFILLSITSIFSFMFIILLVATATLDGLPPSRTVLNCFHLLWLFLLYRLLGWLCRLPGWFYSIAFTFTLTCITFNLYYYCIIVLPLPTLCLYIYICMHLTDRIGDLNKIVNTFSLALSLPLSLSILLWRPRFPQSNLLKS